MNVVLDTNVFVSSFLGGPPRQIVDLWKQGAITLCLSAPIVDEYVEVLARLGVADDRDLKDLLRFFAEGRGVLFAAQTPTLDVVKADPDDNRFLECAVALKAECVVSGDKALLAVKDYCGIKVLSPRDFLKSYSR